MIVEVVERLPRTDSDIEHPGLTLAPGPAFPSHLTRHEGRQAVDSVAVSFSVSRRRRSHQVHPVWVYDSGVIDKNGAIARDL